MLGNVASPMSFGCVSFRLERGGGESYPLVQHPALLGKPPGLRRFMTVQASFRGNTKVPELLPAGGDSRSISPEER